MFALYRKSGVYVNFEKADGAAFYLILCGDTKDSLSAMYKSKDTSLFTKEHAKGKSFVQGNMQCCNIGYEGTGKTVLAFCSICLYRTGNQGRHGFAPNLAVKNHA